MSDEINDVIDQLSGGVDALGALERLSTATSAKSIQLAAGALKLRFSSVEPQLSQLHSAIASNYPRLARVIGTMGEHLQPVSRFLDLSKADEDDVQMLKFFRSLGGSVVSFATTSVSRLQKINRHLDAILPILRGEGKITAAKVEKAVSDGEFLVSLVAEEFTQTPGSFDKMLGGTYISTKQQYKKLRRKFLGESGKSTVQDDEFENMLMQAFFGGARKDPDQKLGPAVALIDDNCVLTSYLMDIADGLPRVYEKTVPIMRRGKPTGKTKTVQQVDDGEVMDYASSLIQMANPTYYKYILSPQDYLQQILRSLSTFHALYFPVYKALVEVLSSPSDFMGTVDAALLNHPFASPAAIARHYGRINFLAIRPLAEDITPRTKVEKDYANARVKLLTHMRDTVTAISGMDAHEEATEQYAEKQIRTAIELKRKMDEVQKSDYQRNLVRNIRDDNEFYISKAGNLGALEVERAPAPKITYEDVIGESFVRAKDHIDEVVKIASHPHIMRLSAPRGDIRSNLLLIGPFGCHRKGQGILMYDGGVKKVEDIEVGDLLMGPDSRPREVRRLVRGIDTMVEIIPKKGDSWVVNKEHVLSLVKTQRRWKEGGKRYYEPISEAVDVPVSEYLKWGRGEKMIHPLYRSNVVEFAASENSDLPIDPYFLGVILGDGCITKGAAVCTPDAELVEVVKEQASVWGLQVSVDGEGKRTAPNYHLTTGYRGGVPNPLSSVLGELGLRGLTSGDKYIPNRYKTSSIENRMAILAGLLDTDGHLYGGSCYEYSTKSKQLSDDVLFVARSLGFAAYCAPCRKSCQTGATGIYYRVTISGDVDLLPLRVARKKASPRRQKKNVRRVGFSTRVLGKEKFYGFTVDGDHRYLLGDFTVTHNCGKSEIARAVGSDKRIIGLNVTVADMLTAYMHESVKNVKRLYDSAKDLRRQSRYTKPVGILLDEIDRLFDYGEGVHQAYDGARMTGVLQEMMDGIVGYEGVFLLGMTNVPKKIPKAVLRRFKYVDVVGQLNRQERADLFRKFVAKGLPISSEVGDADYLAWSDQLDHAPGDVIGKVADEIHFKFMHEFVAKHTTKAAGIERMLAKRLKDREVKPADMDYIRKALSVGGTIGKTEIQLALDTVLKQPQVQMQIDAAKQCYRDADEIKQGLATVGDAGFGFGSSGKKRSVLWTD